jgi:tetratricopeptide (TPR) repeat protein
MGQYQEAKQLLKIVFDKAKTPIDKAPAWVLQSRIYAQEGDSPAAFDALKQCLAALDIEVDDNPSFQKCDAEFERLSLKIQSIDTEQLINKAMTKDSNLAAVGAVLVETISAAFWSDTLTFYQMSLIMVQTTLSCGSFPQSGMCFIYLGMIAITRFRMIKFACEMGNISLALMDRWRDNYTMGRGGTIYSLFIGHVHLNLQKSLSQLEGALEYAILAGDRISAILNFGLVGNLKLFGSEHLADLEAFCTYGCEEIPNWQQDTRGGTLIIAIRQGCRALQGKTYHKTSSEIMSDDSFNSAHYKRWIRGSQKNSDRALFFYESIEIAPLFLFGFYAEAVDLGNENLKRVDTVWSARNTRFLMLFHGLSLAGMMWAKL